MTNTLNLDIKNFNQSTDIKQIHKSKNIPKNWKKFGEVYCNEQERPIFICLICLEKADCINTSYNTCDGSAFWWHIQQQHIFEECETIDQISEEIRKFQTNEKVSKDEDCLKISDTDSNEDTIKEHQLKLLEIFHENLIRNSVIKENNVDVKKETELNQNENKPLLNKFDKSDVEIKTNLEEDEKNANCNYYYDNETYTISDDDDDDDDEDDEEDESPEHQLIAEQNRTSNYLKHNDMIEISDDEVDIDIQDEVDTRPNSPTLSNEGKRIDEGTAAIDINCIEILHHMRSQNIEENLFTRLNTCPMYSIPTPDLSPCESLTKQLNDTSSNKSHNEQYCGNTQSNQFQTLSKKRITTFRPFQCKVCGVRTINEKNMLTHQQRVHNITSKEFNNNIFSQKQYHHIEQPYSDHQRNLLESDDHHKKSRRKPFKCKSCNRSSKTEKAMERHQQLYHSSDSHLLTTQCEICHKRILKQKLQKHMQFHSFDGYKCNYCGVVYKQKYYLNCHISKYHSIENSVPLNPQLLETICNISSNSVEQINSIPANCTSEEEQQLRYRECEEIWNLFVKSNCNKIQRDSS